MFKIKRSLKRDLGNSILIGDEENVFLIINELLIESKYKITSKSGNVIYFTLGTSGNTEPLGRQDIGLYCNSGEIKITKIANSASIELTYFISYLVDLLMSLWICYLGHSVSKGMYWGLVLTVSYFFYRQKIISNRCDQMMDDIAYALS